MRLIIPINITHGADIDGIGCAALSRLAFNNSFAKSKTTTDVIFLSTPEIIPVGNTEDGQIKSINGCDSEHIETLIKYAKQQSELIGSFHKDKSSNTMCDLTFLIIVTDVSVSDVVINTLYDKLNVIYEKSFKDSINKPTMYIWKIDHHETNKYYGMHAVTYVTDDLDIPAFVTIISNDLERANQERFGVTRLDMKPRDEDDLDQLLDTYGFNDNYHPDRSASALYFYFLLTTGMLDNLKFGVLTNLVKVVYHISAYDTFEFDKLNPRLPFVSEHPDALTVLWKSFHGKFFDMLFIMIECICNNDTITVIRLDDGTQKYPDLPLTSTIIANLDMLYSSRQNELENSLRNIRVIPYGIFRNILGIKYNGISDFDNIAIFPMNVGDTSHLGNYVVKNYNIKIAAMLYTDSPLISFRSNNRDENAPDVSEIAKELGGGGHKNAAGSKLTVTQITDLLKITWITPIGIPEHAKLQE